MRRPLALIGFTLFGCSFAYVVLGDEIGRWGALAFGVLALAVLPLRRFFANKHHWAWCQCFTLTVALSLTFMCVTTALTVKPLHAVVNTAPTVTMTVIEQDGVYDTAQYYIVKAAGVCENEQTLRLRLRVNGKTDYMPGQVLQGKVTLQSVDPANQGKLYAKRVWLEAVAREAEALTCGGVDKNFYYYCGQVRHALKDWIHRTLSGDTAALVSGVCLGDTGGMSSEAYGDFTRCGMGHMVAVSGLHTSTLSGLLVALLLMLRTKRRYAKVLSLGLVWAFIFMVGMPFSAVRAGIMFTFWAGISLFFRLPDGLNTLGGAALIILLFHPFAAGDIGFLASFLSCLGILWFATPVTNGLLKLFPLSWQGRRPIVWLCGGMGVTLSVLFTTLPCSLLRFHTLSLVSPIANLVGIPLATVVLLTGLLSGLAALIPGGELVGELLLQMGGLCADGLLRLSRTLSQIPYASVQFATLWCWLAFLLAALTVAAVYCLRRKIPRWGKNTVACVLAAVLVVSTFLPHYSSRQYEVLVVGDEYDTAMVVCCQQGTAVIGCARVSEIKKILYARGIHRVDCWFLPDSVQYKENITALSQQLSIGQIYVKPSMIEKEELLPPPNTYEGLAVAYQHRLGNLSITANLTFSQFEVALGGKTVVLEQEKTFNHTEGTHVVTHAALLPTKGFRVKSEESTRIYTQTVRLYLHEPKDSWEQVNTIY